MAGPFYLDSAGDNTTGTSWATAKTTFSAAFALLTTGGEILYVANTHSETAITAASIDWPGAFAEAHCKLISAETTGTTYTRGAVLGFAAGTETWTGNVDCSGIDFENKTTGQFTAAIRGVFRDCNFELQYSMGFDHWDQPYIIFDQCGFKLTASTAEVICNGKYQLFNNCRILSGTVSATHFIEWSNGGSVQVFGLDASNMPTSSALIQFNNSEEKGFCQLSGVLLPTSGTVRNTAITGSGVIHATSIGVAADIIAGIHIESRSGLAVDDTAIYRTATYDGTNEYSLKITPKARGNFEEPLRFKIFERYITANPTLTTHFVYDDATNLQNDELWVEIYYPDSTNPVLRKLDITSRAADMTATPANLSASTESWTGTSGFTNENKDQIAVTISGGGAGVHAVYLCYGKGATTPVLYACPRVEVS